MLITRTFKAMGSRCELQIYAADPSQAPSLFAELIGEVSRLEKKFSRYLPDSVISRINAAAGQGSAISLDAETAKLFEYADMLYAQSDGMFDITSGVLRQVWDFRSDTLPSDSDIDRVVGLIGWRDVQRDENEIYLPRVGMEVDFGGFAKEYAVDVVATRCLELGIRHGIVNLGGDIRVVGPHLDGSGWRVGIQHPRSPSEAIASIEVQTGAVATSGDYERFMLVDGQRYCHLLNPRTGRSLAPQYASVSILGDSCLIAGSFSTLAMLRQDDAAEWLNSTGLAHLLVDQAMDVSGTTAHATVSTIGASD